LQTARVLLFLNATNLSNQTARNSASFLKDIAPLPGRALRSGVRVSF
jgi:iron complex outermembrane receptor protein